MTIAHRRDPLPFADVDEIVAALRRAGHRVSRPGRVVLDALFAADGPVTADEIADGLGGRLPALELTSVYRNLERLERLGVVSHVHVGHGPGRYALARGGDPEYLVCDRCGAMATADHAALAPVRDAVRAAFGYEASFRHFPMHGLCRTCAGSDLP
jgi:Fur family ferric uptake transcriptional regulator